jgi:hypothetical protein
LVFNLFANTATTTMRRMPARPMVFTGRDTFITESSWVWAHGRDGVMATAGAAIGSLTAVAEAIAAVGARQQLAATRLAAAAERPAVAAEQRAQAAADMR